MTSTIPSNPNHVLVEFFNSTIALDWFLAPDITSHRLGALWSRTLSKLSLAPEGEYDLDVIMVSQGQQHVFLNRTLIAKMTHLRHFGNN